jgi:hypothetical protein
MTPRDSLFSVTETRALLELGIEHHGRYLTESEYVGILAVIDRLEGRLTRIADETREHPGLGLLHHLAIGTHDEDNARVG